MLRFIEDDSVALALRDFEVLEQIQSEYQKIELINHSQLGKMLIIDDEIQHAERWSPIYHETLIHVPAMFLHTIKSALILGGGDLYAARELLKYDSIERILLIDIDASIIDLTSKYYDHAELVLKDPRLEIMISDAFLEIDHIHELFDLVVNDSLDLTRDDLPAKIFGRLGKLNTEKGVCVDLMWRHVFEKKCAEKTLQHLLAQSSSFATSLISVPEYPGMLHLLYMWSLSTVVSQDLVKSINVHHQQGNIVKKFNYFNPDFIKFYLYIPSYIKEELHI